MVCGYGNKSRIHRRYKGKVRDKGKLGLRKKMLDLKEFNFAMPLIAVVLSTLRIRLTTA